MATTMHEGYSSVADLEGGGGGGGFRGSEPQFIVDLVILMQ